MKAFYKFAAIVFFANFILITYFVYDGAFAFKEIVVENQNMADKVIGQTIVMSIWMGSLLVAFVAMTLFSFSKEPDLQLTESDLKSLEETAEAANNEASEKARLERELKEQLIAKEKQQAATLVSSFNAQVFEGALEEKATRMLKQLAGITESGQGLIYLRNSEDTIDLTGTYAFIPQEGASYEIEFGSGFVGEAARSQRVLSIKDIPETYLNIVSGLGNTLPEHLLIVPMVHENFLVGVFELGTLKVLNTFEEQAILQIASTMAAQLIGDLDQDAFAPSSEAEPTAITEQALAE